MLRAFDRQVAVPAIRDTNELSRALQETDFFDQSQVGQVITEIQQQFAPRRNEQAQQGVRVEPVVRVNLGIKQVLKLARQSQVVGDGGDQTYWFAGKLGELIAGANA